jgi:putative addiction module component (TIGR02574 family)
MADFSKLLEEALLLDVQNRAVLAEKLLASLDGVPPEEAERLWADEAERRLAALRSGDGKTVSAEEVAQKVEQLLR